MNKIIALLFIITIHQISAQSDYFQQQVNTTISVILDDSTHVLNGNETMIYINNSNQKLDSILIHLWPNAYKNVDTELAKQKLEDGDTDLKYAYFHERGYIDSLDFYVDNEKTEWNYFNNKIDIAVIYLKESLKPKDSISIETPFRVKIPSGKFSRLGHVGQSYQITQWFPKPAVYDKDGWHPMSYLDQGEFYSEFGNYDVSITVPENYVLMATGNLQNSNEITFLNKKAIETQQLIEDNKLPIRNKYGRRDLSFPKSSKKTKTLRFTQKNIHDFAWFTDKRYHVLKGNVVLPKSNKNVTTWALFTNNEAELWRESIEYLNDATLYFSKWVGEYPYEHVTAVDGTISAGGGMEYPNITVIGASGNSKGLETVIIHEVGHNWYYGILGNNERDNAWMDEGLNTYIEIRYMQEKYPYGYKRKTDSSKNKKRGITINIPLEEKQMQSIGYQFNASRNLDQPLQMGSQNFTSFNYAGMIYSKTGLGFHYLKAYLGEELFDSAMNEYFDKWKFKHPNPYDIQETFEKRSEKDLTWFFDGFIKTCQKTDYYIKKVKHINDKQYLIKIKNHTGFASPIPIQGININEDTIVILKEHWLDGFKKDTSIIYDINSKPSHFALDHELITTDFNYYHHLSKSDGIVQFKKPIKIKFIPFDITNNEVNHIYWAPLLAWNAYDRIMPGIALYNKGIKTKKTEWLVSPFYSFKNNSLNGFGEINHNLNFDNFIKRIEFGYKLKSFSSRFEPTISNDRWIRQEIFSELSIKEKRIRYSPSQKILTRAIKIDDHYISGNSIFPPESMRQSAYYGQIQYSIKNKQILKPRSLTFKYTHGLDGNLQNTLISSFELTGHHRLNYNANLDALKIRIFAGYNFKTLSSRYNLFLRGQDGYYDYLYERSYLGRNLNYPLTLAQQSSNSHGSFKINTGMGGSDSWLIATNLSCKLPKVPISLFTDFGAYPSINYNANTLQSVLETQFLYNIGLSFNVEIENKTILGIYLPLIFSNEIEKSFVPGSNKRIEDLSLFQKITFVFNINELNPFKIKKNIRP